MPGPSLKALRARLIDGGEEPSQRLLQDLALDPRPGAQSLYRRLQKRHDSARSERLRIQTLLNFEQLLWKAGSRLIAGVDEAGLGPLAGPVVAAAVILPTDIDLTRVDDSKKLDAATREELDVAIRARAVSVSVAEVDVDEIERLNVYNAGLEAMRCAVAGLTTTPQHVLTDAREIPGLGSIPQNAFEKGDGLSYSIACASIVAKVHRDRLMAELDVRYPGYGLAEHKGYGTERHLAAIRRLGASPIHRRSYAAIRQILGDASPRFYELKRLLDEAAGLPDLQPVQDALRDRGDDLGDDEVKKLAALLGRRRRRMADTAARGRS